APERFTLGRIVVSQENRTLLTGSGSIDRPYESNPPITLHLGGLLLDASELVPQLNLVRDLPPAMRLELSRLTSGKLRLDQVSIESTVNDARSLSPHLIGQIKLDGSFDRISYEPAEPLKLPPLEQFGGKLTVNAGVLTITKGSAKFDDSTLAEIDAHADLGQGLKNAGWGVKLKGDLDAAQLFPAVAAQLRGDAAKRLA